MAFEATHLLMEHLRMMFSIKKLLAWNSTGLRKDRLGVS
jgi:hypothetical protein